MRLSRLAITNYRSIRDTGSIRIEALQALVGENNAGKSNILRALQCFLTAGAGGLTPSDFNTPEALLTIECEFSGLTAEERRKLRQYLLGDRVILRKDHRIETDEVKGKQTVKAEYHGYKAEPTAEHLSIAKIEANHAKPKWEEIAESAGIADWVRNADGKINKTSYRAGIERYIIENEVEYDEPVLGETQALGIPQNLLSGLPEIYLLPAITDYSDEIDRRSTTTVFRRLMASLADRIMRADPRYGELETAVEKIRSLLNPLNAEGDGVRLAALEGVETSLRDVIQKLMPSVTGVSLGVEVEATQDIFSRGVSIKINDGVLTDVVDKGHGMQRSLVFALLQMLMKSDRDGGRAVRPIILAIEEPELYIHPHCQRLNYRVLKEFAGVGLDGVSNDQVIYTTHSPSFVEVASYERIGVVRKPSIDRGTIVRQAAAGVLGDPEEEKAFKLITSFSLRHNEVFFSKHVIIVEGAEDEVGIIAAARKLGRITDLPDELGVSIIHGGGKGEIKKFQQVLNAFGMEYSVLLELDGRGEDDKQSKPIIDLIGHNKLAKVPNRVEDMLGLGRHFDDQRHAVKFFSVPENINGDFEAVVIALLPDQAAA